jgi:hypothetical protein
MSKESFNVVSKRGDRIVLLRRFAVFEVLPTAKKRE